MNPLDIIFALNGYLIALIIFALSLGLAAVVKKGVKWAWGKFSKKTKSVLDELLVAAMIKPVSILIVILGLYAAISVLPEMQGHTKELNLGLASAIILLGAFTATKLINAFFDWYHVEFKKKTKSTVDQQFLSLSRKISYIAVYLFAVILILNIFGVEITAIIAAFGIGGLAVALALQDTLGNFFAGAHIIMDRPIKMGDYIELESGQAGWVDDIGWRSTKLKTRQNNRIIIPNSQLATSRIINYTAPSPETGFAIDCGVSYNDDLEKVERVTLEEAKRILAAVPGGVPSFEPTIRYKEFGDSNINFSINLRATSYLDKELITHEFIKALKKRYDQEGIDISFPCMNVWMRK